MRDWFAQHAAGTVEVWVGFHKKGSGKPSITWPESVDEALCIGWIDGVRKRIDDDSYMIRFTPRKATSNWSAVNIARVATLTGEGRMTTAGLAAFAQRSDARSGIYAYEQRKGATLDAEQERRFRAHPKAWSWFEQQAPSYQQVVIWRVVSAKRPETRDRRLDEAIACSARCERIPSLRR